MKKRNIVIIIILILIILTLVVLLTYKLTPVLKYESKKLPEFKTEVTIATSIYDYISLEDGRYLIVDDDMRRIVEYENDEFKRVVMSNDIIKHEEVNELGRIRSFSKVKDKIYISTTTRNLFILDLKKDQYAYPGLVNAYSIAENKDKDVYFFSFGKELIKLGKVDKRYEKELPSKLNELKVKNKYIYALSKNDNKIIKINKNFKEEAKEVIKLTVNKKIISYDIEKEIYLLVYDYETRLNTIFVYDLEGNVKRVEELVNGIETGHIIKEKNRIVLVSIEESKLYFYNENYELTKEINGKPIDQVYDFFDPRYALPYENGYLISDDDNDRVLYVECENYKDCNIKNELKAYRPRQISVYDNLICFGKYQNGISCYDKDFKLIKEIKQFENQLLERARGVNINEEGLFISGSDSGCVYKLTPNFEEVNKVCEIGEPRYITKMERYVVVIDVINNNLNFINPKSMEIEKKIDLQGGTMPRGIAYKNEILYVVFKRDGLFKTKLFKNGEVIEKPMFLFVDGVTNARGVEFDKTNLLVCDEGEGVIKVYKRDVLKEEIKIQTQENYEANSY